METNTKINKQVKTIIYQPAKIIQITSIKVSQIINKITTFLVNIKTKFTTLYREYHTKVTKLKIIKIKLNSKTQT